MRKNVEFLIMVMTMVISKEGIIVISQESMEVLGREIVISRLN